MFNVGLHGGVVVRADRTRHDLMVMETLYRWVFYFGRKLQYENDISKHDIVD